MTKIIPKPILTQKICTECPIPMPNIKGSVFTNPYFKLESVISVLLGPGVINITNKKDSNEKKYVELSTKLLMQKYLYQKLSE